MLKPINKTATVTFAKIVAMVEASQDKHIKLNNAEGAFMALSAERLYDIQFMGDNDAVVYSLSHYYEQNGDLVPDPDMTFAFCNGLCYPLTYQTAYSYQEAVVNREGVWKYNKSMYNDLVYFAGMWLKNIKMQQEI